MLYKMVNFANDWLSYPIRKSYCYLNNNAIPMNFFLEIIWKIDWNLFFINYIIINIIINIISLQESGQNTGQIDIRITAKVTAKEPLGTLFRNTIRNTIRKYNVNKITINCPSSEYSSDRNVEISMTFNGK